MRTLRRTAPDTVCLVFPTGELFDRLDEQPDYHYTEAECAKLVKQMLSAVRYLHSKGRSLARVCRHKL